MKLKMKRFLGILLSLTLMLGLMPGMGLTAYAAPTETLLTTITGTGSNASTATSANVSYSTEGVATLTFSGSVSYQASPAWGWWGYSWTATVNAAEGYTITKCVFYDDANRTATDSSSPFVVETTEEDKTPRINGTPIDDGKSQSKGLKKIEVYGYATPAHTHDFTYAASGATITATCAAGCPDSYDTTPATLTIAAEGGTYDGTTVYSATVTNNIPAVTGDTVGSVAYYKVDTAGATTGGTAQAGAPTGAGYYYASVTLTSGSNTYTAVKAFTVAKIDPTAPTGLTATYGQKLSDVDLPTGWTWVDSTQSVGSVVSPAATFKANFAGDDNHNAASNVDVAVTVNKAALTVKALDQSIYVGGTVPDLSNPVLGTHYTIEGLQGSDTLLISLSLGYVDENGNTYNVNSNTPVTCYIHPSGQSYTDNYTITYVNGTLTINDKQTQTITADDMTVTYGETGRSVSATTDGDGALSYAVKSGDAVTVDAATGALTTRKVGTAIVTVTAAETETYAAATKDVTVTVIKADASRDIPEKALSFTGQPQELVTAGTVSGGTLQYVLGTDANTAPTDGWSTEIPTGTEPGTYFVWYRVLGDENHNGVDPACIVVTIAEPTSQETPAATPVALESVSDYTLLASMKISGDKAFKLKWTAVTGAEGYDVFFGDCGGGECQLERTVTGLSCKIGKLKKGNAYKAFVKAWKTENGQKVYIGQASPDVHAVAGGKSNKYTNAKKITVKKKKLTVAVGGSKKIKASLKKFSNSRRYLNHTAKIRYYSSNRAVATVNAKGKVTGVAPGTCTVYAVAENGLRKGVKVTVK